MDKVHEYIGVDLGMVRSGLARGNDAARVAEPMQVVETDKLPAVLAELFEKGVSGVVFGLPRGLEGDDTQQTKWVRQWVAALKLSRPAYWQDEALTTKLAQTRSKSPATDAEAAAEILQDFLNSPPEERANC